jgi:hypothetical protein
MRLGSLSAMLLAVLTMLTAVAARSDEKKVRRSDLPVAVQEAVDEQSNGATVRGFSEEKEKGSTFYEAQMLVNGHRKDVLFDSAGKVVEVEEEVAFDSLPPEVKSGLRAKAGSGKLGKVESLTRKGKLVAYEAKVVTNGKRSQVQVGPNGQALDHEE